MPSKQVLTISLETYPQSEEDSQSEPDRDVDVLDCDPDTLKALNITLVARLYLPRVGSDWNVADIAAESVSRGTDAFMTPERFHDFLHMLHKMVPFTEGSAHTWIDAFFFRAAAMVPPSQYMLVSATQAKFPGVFLPLTHCASIHEKDDTPGVAQELKDLRGEPTHNGFFLAQGRQSFLAEDVPRAVVDMYAVAQRTGQPVLRGALTNGWDWVFLILSCNPDGQGATYKESAVISLVKRGTWDKEELREPYPHVIALLLTTWVQRRFTDFEKDVDWLEDRWQRS